MKAASTNQIIPNNIPELQQLVTQLLSKVDDHISEIKKQTAKITEQNTEIELLRHKLQAQLAARFSSKS